ncbi:hypothetical protein F5144DRAFT_517952 [Chaetomium tenue]|uniref:Uncharacterized protein n=1 Tax=Chaetomium tenue TaxID=1854479 RepID=A0ACB7NZP1_9PEZI|nr:hypothetical protein F5144DRAFT_517952 [Chaetomium globosum]
MDSDEISEYSSESSGRAESVPDLDDILAPLSHDIAAWLGTRPDPSSVDIVTAYDELRRLDIKENLLLPGLEMKKRDECCPFPKPAAMVIRDAKWDAISRVFEPRRQLLRLKALELSRGGLRPLKITDVPLDVWHIIFHNFQDDAITEAAHWRRGVDWDEYDGAEKISKTPLMAAGVRGIQVSIGYRPKEYADSIARFKEIRLAAVATFEECCTYENGPEEDFGPEEADSHSEYREVQRATELRRAMKNYNRIRYQWAECVRAAEAGEVLVRPLSKYQKIFQEGHAEYCRLLKEQHEVLQNSNFANSLAAAASQMPNVHCLHFREPVPDYLRHDHVEALNDTRIISRLMSSPVNSRDIGYESLSIKEAVRTLESMLESFEMNFRDAGRLRKTPLSHEDKSHLDTFVGTILSRCGQHLRILKLHFNEMAIDTGEVVRRSYPADSILSTQKLPEIRYLDLHYLKLDEKALNAFCRGLRNNIWRFSLCGIAVHSGVWAHAIDILRNKMSATTATGMGKGQGDRASVSLKYLWGGEFGTGFSLYDNESPLLPGAGKYVKGILNFNPLKGQN